MQYLDFEQPLADMDAKIAEVHKNNALQGLNTSKELERLTAKKERLMRDIYKNLDAWQKTAVARHNDRPHTMDYIQAFIKNFTELRGDRSFADDRAIIGGIGQFNGQTVMVIGHEKGRDTEGHLQHNFGMAKPEGYRKAIRLMKLAEQFNLPILTFIDTAGAYPGLEGEERGQGQAIASCTETCLNVRVPVIATIIGEGGSGGAIALAAANTVLMLENSIYSVISPEGCASILWKDFKFAPKAANMLSLTAQDLLTHKIIDTIIPEPIGGAHHAPDETIVAVQQALTEALQKWGDKTGEELVHLRQEKFLKMTRVA